MNAFAKLYRTQNCELSIDLILGVQAFDLKNALSIDSELLNENTHEHDDTVSSISIVKNGTVNSNKFTTWLNQIIQVQGRNIFRMKGILNVDDEERRFVCQGVHMLIDGRPGQPWKPDEIRKNEIVFIGRDLDKVTIEKGFQNCLE